MEERGRSSLNLGAAPPPKPPPRLKSSHRQRESDPPYMPRHSHPLSTTSASGRDSPPSHRAGERSDTEPSGTATSHHPPPRPIGTCASSTHHSKRRQEIEIGGARDGVLLFRVRLSSFFAGAATTLPVGFYFLYKDYMLAHKAISNKENVIFLRESGSITRYDQLTTTRLALLLNLFRTVLKMASLKRATFTGGGNCCALDTEKAPETRSFPADAILGVVTTRELCKQNTTQCNNREHKDLTWFTRDGLLPPAARNSLSQKWKKEYFNSNKPLFSPYKGISQICGIRITSCRAFRCRGLPFCFHHNATPYSPRHFYLYIWVNRLG